tara:strand:+ start:598 stop:4056 length:3459 start_codon:yes stop_codon:yes gene_type:complete
MELNAAKNLVEKVFSSYYSRENFKQLAAEIFNGYDRNEQSIHQENFDVKNFTNLGLYEADEGKKIAVYEVELLNAKSLHHARVAQRNLIASQLKSYNYDGALISFYHANQDEWRVSFITRESSIDIDADKLKFIEHLTPARRKSFIAGPNEGSHTAKKQFLERLQSTDKPSFDEIACIFEIEAVNNDFYEQYKELYLRLTEELDRFIANDEVIAEDFKDKDVSASDFAKKTLGQFVFLYFIQKKGWIKDIDNPDNRFSFNMLFDNKDLYGDNFFNDIIEPIFYEALAKKDPNDDDYSVLKYYHFPYLNGGLFEPIQGYDWKKTSIKISDDFFSNKNKTKDGDIGNGLFDVFNRFNFTIYENDPIEQDIAVDPEMLGKVFEKLLNRKDRKDDGAFYTPREIVKYMCQESLINYLISRIGNEIKPEVLDLLIRKYSILQPSDINDTELSAITENAFTLDQLLADVKVCDPAIGSGAFPMGMLNEIVTTRRFLQTFFPNKQSIYELKLHSIRESLYGVDLDPSAVDIARLRFWLSLIIEVETPTPLPNLEHKLMQGNSLLSSYEGIELFNDQLLINVDSKQEKLNNIDKEAKLLEKELEVFNTKNIFEIKTIKNHLNRLYNKKKEIESKNTIISKTEMLFESEDAHSRLKKQVDLLQLKISQFLLPSGENNKEDLKNEIENIKWHLIEASVDSEKKAKAFQRLKNKRIQPFFLWKLEFIDIFRNNGFDLVIGNPPYIMEDENKEAFDGLHSHPCYQGKTDIWHLFTGTALSLLKEKGHLTFIAKNQWLCSASAVKMREVIYRNSNIRSIVDFGANMVFDNAYQQTMIMFLEKDFDNDIHEIEYIKFDKIFKLGNLFKNLTNRFSNLDGLIITNKKFPKNFDKNENLTFSSGIKELILNKVNAKANFEFDPKQEITQGIIGGPDKAFIISKEELEHFNEDEKKFIKMLHTGTQNFFTPNSNKYLFYISKKNFDDKKIDNYPNIKNYFESNKDLLIAKKKKYKTPNKPYFYLHRERDESFFISGPKLVWAKRTEGKRFTYSKEPIYGTANMFFIKSERVSLKYLTALLNSELFYFYMGERLKHTGDLLQIDKNQFLKIPLYVPDKTKDFEKLVDNIVEAKKNNQDTCVFQNQLDQLVYKLYDLYEDEIKIIEDSISI